MSQPTKSRKSPSGVTTPPPSTQTPGPPPSMAPPPSPRSTTTHGSSPTSSPLSRNVAPPSWKPVNSPQLCLLLRLLVTISATGSTVPLAAGSQWLLTLLATATTSPRDLSIHSPSPAKAASGLLSLV